MLKNKKYGQFLAGVIRNSQCKRIGFFGKFISLIDGLNDKEIEFITKAKIYIYKRCNIGINIKVANAYPEVVYIPYIRVLDFLRSTCEGSLSKPEIEDMKKMVQYSYS